MKLKISSGVFTLESSIKVDDILLLKRQNPETLLLKNEDCEILFAVDYKPGLGGVSDWGITFSNKGLENGNAVFNGTIPNDIDDVSKAKEYVADKFGCVLTFLSRMEEIIPVKVTEIRQARQSIIDSITVA